MSHTGVTEIYLLELIKKYMKIAVDGDKSEGGIKECYFLLEVNVCQIVFGTWRRHFTSSTMVDNSGKNNRFRCKNNVTQFFY